MSSKNKFEIKNIFCFECGISISINERQKESKVKLNYFYCPQCGGHIEYKKYLTENLRNSDSPYRNDNNDKLNKALDIILYDDDFSKMFRNNLQIFIARMSYVKLLEFASEIKMSISQIDLNKELIDTIKVRLVPISTKKPMLSILKYFNDLLCEDFLSDLEEYQKKIRKNRTYRKAFFTYVKWIIEMVFKIINQIDNKEILFNYERRIRDDLVQFFLDWKRMIKKLLLKNTIISQKNLKKPNSRKMNLIL